MWILENIKNIIKSIQLVGIKDFMIDKKFAGGFICGCIVTYILF